MKSINKEKADETKTCQPGLFDFYTEEMFEKVVVGVNVQPISLKEFLADFYET